MTKSSRSFVFYLFPSNLRAINEIFWEISLPEKLTNLTWKLPQNVRSSYEKFLFTQFLYTKMEHFAKISC